VTPPDRGSSTRDRILASALELAGREGLGALTTRRVAREAGVNLGLLHYYFESKEALVGETLAGFIAGLRAFIMDIDLGDRDQDPEELLVAAFTGILSRLSARPGLLFGLVGLIVETVSRLVGPGAEGKTIGDPALLPPPLGPVAEGLRYLVERMTFLLALRLGSDRALVARRSIQLFASFFHPFIFTPFPSAIFGLALGTAEGRETYVRGVVADALSPPQVPETRKDATMSSKPSVPESGNGQRE
jgi:AcrR family transcriptional regulator